MKAIFVTLLLLCPSLFADPLAGSQELGTSISGAYDARSTFTNPAALGFQTELNGFNPLTSFSYGVNRGYTDEFSLGVSAGYFGFGAEWIQAPPSSYRRFDFGLGIPVTSWLFAGARYRLNRGTSNTASVDTGFQLRPSTFFSFGFMANGLNKKSTQLVGGITVRPLSMVELSADIDTPSTAFGKQVSYQVLAGVEVLRGLKLRVGYHDQYKLQLGLTWNFGNASLYSTMQPSSSSRRLVSGFQLAPLAYPSAFQSVTALKVDIDGSLREEPSRGSLFVGESPSLIELLEKLNGLEDHPEVRAVVIRMERFPLGLASAEELFLSLSALRDRGIHIEVFLSSAGMKEYLIASAANVIHLEAGGELRFPGLRAEHYFVTGTLDKIGVKGEFLAKGEYKSAPEMFSRKESSPLNRETTLDELKIAESIMLNLMSRYGRVTNQSWKSVLSTAIYSPLEAKQAKLIDDVGGYTQSHERLTSQFAMKESLSQNRDDLALPSKIAVVFAEGSILQHKYGLDLGGEKVVTPLKIERQLKRALSDSMTKAIVLRVNSPGGEVLASDQIASLVAFARTKKPVVVSMGDVAASGGYMISAPAEKIFANSLTLTGSIGVFLGKFNFKGLFGKIDLHKEILTHGPYPGLLSEDRPWSDAERAIMVRRLNTYYDGFVSYVATSRNITKEEAERAAKGRVWLGREATLLRIVDKLGGYNSAVAEAARLAGVTNYDVWALENNPGLFHFFSIDGIFGMGATSASVPGELLSGLLSRKAIRDLLWMRQLSESPYLYLSSISAIE